jgi:hypothetical protein
VYAAAIDNTPLTFQVSGSLWQDALVMMDMETKSLWSQISGECIQGEMEGRKLSLVPAIHTTFEEFKTLYPAGLILKKEARGDRGSHYKSYFDDKTKLGMFGRADNFQQLPGKERVIGLRVGDYAGAVSLIHLEEQGYVLIETISPPLVVSYDPASLTAAAFKLPAGLTDLPSKIVITTDLIQVSKPKAAWHPHTGRAVTDKTEDLEAVPVITAFWFAWATFFPETELVHSDRRDKN